MSDELLEPPKLVRRRVRPAEPPPVVDHAPQAVEAKPEPPARPERGLQPISLWFIGCLAVGTAGAAVGWFDIPGAQKVAFIGPIGATLAYPIKGALSGWHNRPGIREKFADNCYYLGFIFTQIALVFGFAPSALFGAEITAQDVLRYFGMALGSSLFGLVARTIFTQMVDTSTVDDEVEALAKEVTRHSKIILDEFASISTTLGQRQEGATQALQETSEAISRTLSGYGAALERASNNLNVAQQSVTDATSQIEGRTAESQRKLAEAMSLAGSAISTLQMELGAKVHAATVAIEGTSQAISAGLAGLQSLPEIRTAIGHAEETLEALERRLGDLHETSVRAGAQVAATTEAFSSDLGGTIRDASEQLRSATRDQAQQFEQDLTEAVQSLDAMLKRFRHELERVHAS